MRQPSAGPTVAEPPALICARCASHHRSISVLPAGPPLRWHARTRARKLCCAALRSCATSAAVRPSAPIVIATLRRCGCLPLPAGSGDGAAACAQADRSAAPSRQRAAVRCNRRTLAGLGQPDEWRHRTAPISKVTTSPGKRRCSCSSRSERLVNCASTNTGPECCGGWSGAPRDPFGRLVLQRHHPEVIATETVGSITDSIQKACNTQHATCGAPSHHRTSARTHTA